jgi:hypothetical protein
MDNSLYPGDMTVTSDNNILSFMCTTKLSDNEISSSELISCKDYIHMMIISAAAQFDLLRQAIGVTVITNLIPALNPHKLITNAIAILLNDFDISSFIKFLVDRNLIVLTSVPQTTHNISDKTCNMESFKRKSIIKNETANTTYLASDFECNYVNRFISQAFLDDNNNKQMELIISTDSHTCSSGNYPNGDTMITESTWSNANIAIRNMLSLILTGSTYNSVSKIKEVI